MKTEDLNKYLKLNYPIEVKKLEDDEGGGYLVSIPYLGRDAFVGNGNTLDEALDSLEDTKRMLFEDYLRRGLEIPLPPSDNQYSGKFVVRLPAFMHRELVEQAQANDISLNTYCVSLLATGMGADFGKKCIKELMTPLILNLSDMIKSINYQFGEGFTRRDTVYGPVLYVTEGKYAKTG
jgi:predicted HicB family RNase H-like nuclease